MSWLIDALTIVHISYIFVKSSILNQVLALLYAMSKGIGIVDSNLFS